MGFVFSPGFRVLLCVLSSLAIVSLTKLTALVILFVLVYVSCLDTCVRVSLPLRVIVRVLIMAFTGHSLIFDCDVWDAMCSSVSSSSCHSLSSNYGVYWS